MAQTDRTTGLVGNAAFKVPCRVATTADITLSGLQTIDGVALAALDRVLVKDQDDPTENGIWVADTAAWSRAQDFDGAYDVVQGSFIYVTAGTLSANTYWRITTANPITIGTSNITIQYAVINDDATIEVQLDATGAVARTQHDRNEQLPMRSDFVSDADFDTAVAAIASPQLSALQSKFVQAGTGAVARTMLTKARENFSPDDFGAVGDGVTDDTPSVILAGNALQAAGGGCLRFTPGKNYLLFKNGVAYAQAPIQLSNLTGVVIDWTGATLTLDPAKSWVGSNADFILCTACNDVTVHGGYVVGSAIAIDGTFTGVIVVHMKGDSRGLNIPYMRVNKAFAPLLLDTPTSTGVRGVNIGTLDVTGCIYGVNAANSGSDMVIDNLITDGCGRSLFSYGVNNVKARVRSKNPKLSADCSFSAVTASYQTIRGFDLEYTNLESTAGAGVGVQVAHSNGDTVGASTISDVNVKLNVALAGSGMSSAFLYAKFLADGTADTVDRGHTLRGVDVSGIVDGAPATGVAVQFGNTGSTWGAGENCYGISLKKLEVINNTNSPSVDLKRIVPSLKGILSMTDVHTPKAIDVWGGASPSTYVPTSTGARIEANNVICTNLDTPYEGTESLLGVNVIAIANSPFALYDIHRGKTFTNNFSAGAVTFNLPTAVPGRAFAFSQTVANNMFIDPNVADSIIGGAGAGKYISLQAVGSTLHVVCRNAGVWDVLTRGTIVYEA